MPGFADCDMDPSNGCEASLTSVDHCGTCADSCTSTVMNVTTPLCTGGACAYDTCSAGFGDCDGDATNGCEAPLDTLTDCGGCNKPCSAPANTQAASCSAMGVCGYTACNVGFLDCDGNPANGCEAPSATQTNCGKCGNVCPAGGICNGTLCTLTRWTDGSVAWPDDACNSNTSFGQCDSNAQNEADAWATWICQHNGWTQGVWTGAKTMGCSSGIMSGAPSQSFYCNAASIPCVPDIETTCQPGDQTTVQFTCTK